MIILWMKKLILEVVNMKHGNAGTFPPPLSGEFDEPLGLVWHGLHSWTVLPTQVCYHSWKSKKSCELQFKDRIFGLVCVTNSLGCKDLFDLSVLLTINVVLKTNISGTLWCTAGAVLWQRWTGWTLPLIQSALAGILLLSLIQSFSVLSFLSFFSSSKVLWYVFPPHPKCIGRIHLYSDMWRHFDNGLYLFMQKYIYRY